MLDINLVLFGLAPAGVAVAVRFYDVPKTEFSWGEFGKALVGSGIAVGLSMWMLGFDNIFKPEMFAVVAGAGVGGMAFVRGFIDRFKPKE